MFTIPEEVLDFCTQYNQDTSKIIQDQSDGLLIYDGNMDLANQDFNEVPKALLHFKEIKGYLSFYECRNLKSIENLKNLRCVGGNLIFDYCTNLQSLKGLENLEYIGWELDIRGCENLHSYKGLNPFINTVRYSGGHKIYPSSRRKEFLDYVEYEKEKRIFKFVETL